MEVNTNGPPARDPRPPTRLGVFGGTFDPIHRGHLAVAEALSTRFGFDRLLFIPAYAPPHKQGRTITHACHRFAMAALALAHRTDWVLSTVEVESPERPYTVDTVSRLSDLYPSATPIHFILGADSFEELDTWHEYLRLVESCHIIVTTRPGHDLDSGHLPDQVRRRLVDLRGTAGAPAPDDAAGETRIYLTEDAFVDISSTAVREAVRKGRQVRDMVPEAVAAYIEKQELFKGENE
jgi:nicotinate-nucleotide adenylyltransferase